MSPIRVRTMAVVAALAAFPLATPHRALAQGVTTSAITGKIKSVEGQPLASIQVVVRNAQTGSQTGSLTNVEGRYFIQGLQPGGSYAIRTSAIGYATQEIAGVTLVLSQATKIDFTLSQQAVQLAGIEVTAERSGVFTQDHTGPATTISDSIVNRMPTLTRNFTDFARTSPMVVGSSGSPSVGGQNNRFNNITIDGAVTNDVFGLGTTGSVGGQVGGKPISADAIQQYQILSAPFDVRHGGFTGGLINAVTRSGTNDFRGSIFFYGRNQNLMSQAPYFDAGAIKFRDASDFKSAQYGGSIGGPVIEDKLFFFVNGELELYNRPLSANSIGRETFATVGVAPDSAARFQQILSGGAYNLEAGDYGAVNLDNPKGNFLARLDWNLSDKHRLTLRDSYARATDESYGTRSSTFYALSSNSYEIQNHSNSAVVELNSTLSDGLFNELLLNYETIRDQRAPRGQFPEIDVAVTSKDPAGTATATRTLVAGGEFSSQANELDQDILEITDNLTMVRGIHKLTLGTHNEFFRFRNLFSQGVWGTYRYASLADLSINKVASYSINVPVENQTLDDVTARFRVNQFGAYVQDQLTLKSGMTITAGVRADMPVFPTKPRENSKFFDAFGLHTSDLPGATVLFSPRLGFNWDVSGDGSFQVRGGAGLFTGRPAYVWLSNSYGNTGRETVNLSCAGTTAANAPPAFNASNPSTTTCAGGLTASAGGAAVVNVIDPDFKFPQELKISGGIDHRLPWGFSGTVEGLYTKSIHQIFTKEINLKSAAGELAPIGADPHGRPLYGTHATATGVATPNRVNTGFLQVVSLTNTSDNYTYLLSGSLTRRFTDRFELLAGYTFSHSYDTQSLTSSVATSNYGFNPISGDPNDPPLAPSAWDMPHKLTFSGTATLFDIPRIGSTDLSLIYTGTSGLVYSYTYNGDVNGDGYQASNISGRNNDLVYVPKDPSDILLRASSSQTVDAQWSGLNSFIENDACLRDHRGEMLPRNSCREPWHNRLDARLAQSVPALRGHRVQILVDVFNVLNLMKQSWGLYQIAPNSTVNMINLVGWDATRNEGIFQWPGSVTNRNFLVPTSQWQIQMGGRYSF